MKEILDFILHLQDHLDQFTVNHGNWVYGLLLLIIFCETGLVITPFLPGDSLLFAVGAVAARPGSGLSAPLAALAIVLAALIGDNTNYWFGRSLGPWAIKRYPKLIKPSHLQRTERFFETYGPKTIILGRFVPIVRTFVPFVAGTGSMPYLRFLSFSVLSSMLWTGIILPCGWFFGAQPFVKKHFELVVLGIIFVSLIPVFIETVKSRCLAEEETVD